MGEKVQRADDTISDLGKDGNISYDDCIMGAAAEEWFVGINKGIIELNCRDLENKTEDVPTNERNEEGRKWKNGI